MTDTTKAQILDLARKAINTEMLALKHMKETLGDNFADAVELILACSGKCIVTGMGKSGLVGRKIAATLASGTCTRCGRRSLSASGDWSDLRSATP